MIRLCFLFVFLLPFFTFCSEEVYPDGSKHLYFVYPQKRASSSPSLITSGVITYSYNSEQVTSQKATVTKTSFEPGNYVLLANFVFSADWPYDFLYSLQIGDWTPMQFTFVPFAISDYKESLLARYSFPSPPNYQASFSLPFTISTYTPYVRIYCTTGSTVTYSIYKYSDSDSIPSPSSSTMLYPSDDSGVISPDAVPGGDSSEPEEPEEPDQPDFPPAPGEPELDPANPFLPYKDKLTPEIIKPSDGGNSDFPVFHINLPWYDFVIDINQVIPQLSGPLETFRKWFLALFKLLASFYFLHSVINLWRRDK